MTTGSIFDRLIVDLKNSFAYEFIVKPGDIHQVDLQSREIPVTSNGKNFIIGPTTGVENNDAGVCVSIGLNGVSVYEYTHTNVFAVLVYEMDIKDWVNVTVVYKNKRPQLFINGTFVKEGERSQKKNVYPSGALFKKDGLFFIGEIKEIRIWDQSRTENQLRTQMNTRLKGGHRGLYASWPERNIQNQRDRFQTSNKEMNKGQDKMRQTEKISSQKSGQSKQSTKSDLNQKIEVSIIIPSYNKYPLNLFTLYSLENQTFDSKKMEVIFIDDTSTDQTEDSLKNYRPPYSFKYIRSNENIGRAKVRNLGIQHSRGSILIFLDAEMLVTPKFVANHVQYHQSKNNMIVTGVMYSKTIVSCIFPKTDPKKLAKIKDMVKDHQKLSGRFKKYDETASEPYPLINKIDIINQSYGDLIKKTNSWFQTIDRNYGAELKGFEFPWMALLTGNVSLRRELLDTAGNFDEDFVKYGYEDWELGYRLYKAGATYFNAKNLITYHQEHPVAESKWKEAIDNYYLFIKKHPDVDVLILGLELSRMTSLTTMNDILQEYKKLVEKFGEQTKGFQSRFMTILETTAILLKVDVRHFNILGAAGYGMDQINKLKSDLRKLNKLGKYKNLANLIQKVIAS